MSFMNTNLRVLCGLALLLICSGCPDPDQVADDFIADREELDTIVPVEGFCPEFSDASGTYMIAVLTPLDQSKYLLMQADVEMADIDASPTIKMVLTPLSVAERAPVGTPIETEAVPVNADGSFELPFGNVAVTGEANPISGGDIEADLTLKGQIRQSDYICGDIVGDLLQPTSFNLKGTTVGLVRVDNADFEGIEPSLACPECN